MVLLRSTCRTSVRVYQTQRALHAVRSVRFSSVYTSSLTRLAIVLPFGIRI